MAVSLRPQRALIAVTAAVLVATAVQSFAQSSGASVYKASCQVCHGATGMADSPVGISMKVKPVANPEVKKMTEAEMVEVVKMGEGRMQSFRGKLTGAEIKDSVAYFRTLLK